jgi:threonine synthase
VGCEPASAVSLAGLRRLVQKGTIRRSDQVVVILTGHILKDPGVLLRYHREMDPPPPGANRPTEIEPTMAALESVLSAS